MRRSRDVCYSAAVGVISGHPVKEPKTTRVILWRRLATFAIASLLAGNRTSSEATISANNRRGRALGLDATQWLAKEQGIQSLLERFGLSAQDQVM
jgi:hypothetical protein